MGRGAQGREGLGSYLQPNSGAYVAVKNGKMKWLRKTMPSQGKMQWLQNPCLLEVFNMESNSMG